MTAQRPWTCPYCGRTVPARIDRCYCGRERPKAPPAEATSPPPQPRSSALRLSAIAIVVALAAAVIFYYSDRRLSTPDPPRAAVVTKPASRAIVRASTSDPELLRPPSDDLIQLALRAIVLVETPAGRGTGYFSSADTVTTSRRALGSDRKATVTTADGRQLDATLAAAAPRYDLAILHVVGAAPAGGYLVSTRTNDVRPGQAIVRIGWPHAVVPGAIRGLQIDNRVELIETDLETTADDSGALLLDRTGRVLGLVTTAHAGTAGSGYAVAVDSARPYLTAP